MITTYGIDEEYNVAFTAFGIENLGQVIQIYRAAASRTTAEPQ
ncbi:hypothetical protein [Thalassobaculum litoreum]|uniref:Uncharacterized protein n=1 Tax=Thalassobaculum litoreum DSM 18839 TaxID=1123362 RepID=A0A8G2BMT4_9PROT|nr:hypothetical protein [Thalassobaculum litoreum]SDG59988.1 hypothetical protein SAMN05660686_04981 [Thalassobaculum litoreum DSM 18839]